MRPYDTQHYTRKLEFSKRNICCCFFRRRGSVEYTQDFFSPNMQGVKQLGTISVYICTKGDECILYMHTYLLLIKVMTSFSLHANEGSMKISIFLTFLAITLAFSEKNKCETCISDTRTCLSQNSCFGHLHEFSAIYGHDLIEGKSQ